MGNYVSEVVMCGRYVRRGDKQRIAEAFHVRGELDGLSMPPDDYNVAPSTFQPVIRESKEDGSREIVLTRWGLIPFFTKQISDIKGISAINAKAENVAKSPTWREPFKKRRLIADHGEFVPTTPKHRYVHFAGDRSTIRSLRRALKLPMLKYPKRSFTETSKTLTLEPN